MSQMTNKHDRFLTGVMLFLFRQYQNNTQVLLQLRQNTGYADGQWDCAAGGHLEKNESLSQACIREAKEELNITVKHVEFATMIHKNNSDLGETFVNVYFYSEDIEGEIKIAEPDKCAALEWFDLDQLPPNLIYDRRIALNNYLNHIPYEEVNFEDEH